MSFADTAVLFVLALLLFGPKKLPGIARQVGKALNEFKRASNELQRTLEEEVRLDDAKKTPPAPPQIGASPETIHSAAKDAIDAVAPPSAATENVPTIHHEEPVARGEHGS